MRRYFYETKSDLPPELLYRAITHVAAWPEWDGDIEMVEIDGPVACGTMVTLKGFGRAKVRLRLDTLVEPYRFADIAYLPLARMRTEYSFIPAPGYTLVRSAVDFTGPLSGFWGRALVADYADGAARQTRRFLAFAGAQSAWIFRKPPPRPDRRVQQPLPNYVFC